MISKHLLALAFLGSALPCFTQTAATTTPTKPTDSSPSYADEAAVIERDDVVYRYADDGAYTKLETTVMRIQSNAALQSLSVLNFPYANDNQRLEIIYSRVRKPDGSVIDTPVSDSQDQPAQVTMVAPMYSDLHIKQLPVRSLAVGDKLEFQVRLTQQQPEIPGQFWGQENFGAGIIFLQRTIELHIPKDKQVTVYSPDHEPDTSETASERTYRWTGSQLHSPTAKNDNDAVPEPKDTKPPIAWTTFPSWAPVGDWYRGLILGRDAVTPAIQAKADELTASAKTDTEKVQAVYNYVSTHNHYIGIDFGIGRYQPHLASEVMTNQYGDCKDKHTLLAALLRAKGFQASAVLIGAGIELNEKVPMPAAFNHVITLVDVSGEKVWLDATTEVAPYRALLSVLRDKQALVVPASGPAQLIKTPSQLPFPSFVQYESKSELDSSGSFKGHVDISLRGDSEILMRSAASRVARTQWDQVSQAYSNGSGFDGTTSATVLDPADDLSGPWHIRYDFTQKPFSEWERYKIGSLLPNIDLPSVDEKKPPKKDIELGSPHTDAAKSTIHLPASYGADLPDAIHLKTPYGTYDKTYIVKDGSLIAERKLETLVDKVPASDWKTYKKFVDDIGVEPWIQLTAKEHTAGEKGPPPAGENNPVAAELVRQVAAAIQAKDYELAQKKSDEALAINEKQSYLWSQRGWLASRHNDYQQAADDYERELKQHPENIDQYQGLIYAEGKAGRKDKQRDSLLAYAKAAPNNESTLLYVGSSLVYLDRLGDAIDVYRAAVAAIPESDNIKSGLGMALLQSGKTDEGAALIKPVIEKSSDPGVLNNTSYTLATHNLELSLAERSARKAVELLETESQQAVLDGANAKSFRQASLLIACWDTLGWIYFMEGKTDLAAPYIRAAWKNSAHPEVGLHYGQLLEKRGDLKQALETYQMALSQEGLNPSGPVDTELNSKASALKKQGIKLENWHPAQALLDGRTYHLPRPAELKGSATFLMQISPTKTENVKFLSGDDALHAEAEELSRLDLGLAIPPDSHVFLLRSGVLYCSTQPICDFVLVPPESANLK